MRVLVTGAGGFIGGHLVRALLDRGDDVVAVDLKPRGDEWEQMPAPDTSYGLHDLRRRDDLDLVLAHQRPFDVIFALAADMGGMGYLAFHEADVMTSNLLIDVNTVRAAVAAGVPEIVYSSSACVYPEYRQLDAQVTPLSEDMAWPAAPDLKYGLEKLATEELLRAYHAEGRLDVRIARLHNIYGEWGSWRGGREKAPAAMCRKAAEAPDGGSIDVWGDGKATRSFCYVSDCIEGLLRLAESDYPEPLNIGSSELVTVDQLAGLAIAASGKTLSIVHVDGPQGVRGRNSDSTLCRKVLGWEPGASLADGIARTYGWIAGELAKARATA